jgi:hypothetical protein
VSPGGGRLFPHRVSRGGDGTVEIAVTRCPMQDAWRDAGIAEGDIATLLPHRRAVRPRLASAPRGCALAAETWRPGREGCCRLRLSPR